MGPPRKGRRLRTGRASGPCTNDRASPPPSPAQGSFSGKTIGNVSQTGGFRLNFAIRSCCLDGASGEMQPQIMGAQIMQIMGGSS